MLIHDVNPRWIIKPISRAAWRTSWHGNGLFTGSRFTAFNLAASLAHQERERERTFRMGVAHSNSILKEEYRNTGATFRLITPPRKETSSSSSPSPLFSSPPHCVEQLNKICGSSHIFRKERSFDSMRNLFNFQFFVFPSKGGRIGNGVFEKS